MNKDIPLELPLVYYCKKCDRFTDVRYISDKDGGRYKSYCYKCGNEMLIPCEVIIKDENHFENIKKIIKRLRELR